MDNNNITPLPQKGFRTMKQPTRAKVIEEFSGVAKQVKEMQDALSSLTKIVFMMVNRVTNIEQRLDASLPFLEFRTSGLIKLMTAKGSFTISELADACAKEELDFLNKQEPVDDKKFNLIVVDRPAQDKDIVLLSYKATDSEGNLVPGLSTEWLQTAIGETNLEFIPKMVPELEAALVGMKAGDSKEVNVVFAADFNSPELAGKSVTFNLTVKRVKEHRITTTPIGGNA